VLDGCKLDIEASGNESIQRRFYNGWTHGHYVSNLFVFAPDGTIVACVLNCPGSVHDSMVGNYCLDKYGKTIYDKLGSVYNRVGGRTVTDSAFCAKHHKFILKSSQNDLNDGSREKRQATSVRQSAEWGNRGLQGAFPRLKGLLKWEDMGERQIILGTMVFLYNYRTRRIGLNQIRSFFMPHESVELNGSLFGFENVDE